MPRTSDILSIIRQAQESGDDTILERNAVRLERTDPESARQLRGLREGMRGGNQRHMAQSGRGRGASSFAEGGDDREPFLGLPITLAITTANGAFNSGTFNPPGSIDYYVNGVSILKPASGEYQMLSVAAGNNETKLGGTVSGGAGAIVGHPVDLLDPRIMQGYDDLLVVSTDVAARDFTFYFNGDTASNTLYLTVYCLPVAGLDAGGARSRFLGPARALSLRKIASSFMGPGR